MRCSPFICNYHLSPCKVNDNTIDHFPYVVFYIPMTSLFYNWHFVPFNPFQFSYLPAPLLPLTTTSLFSVWNHSLKLSVWLNKYLNFFFKG